MNEEKKIRILIADEHPIFVIGLQQVLHSSDLFSCEIVGVARSGDDLLEQLRQETVDLIIMDLNLQGMDGLEVLAYLKKRKWKVRVLACTMYDDPKIVKEAFKTGIDGYVLKQNEQEEVLKAIEAVMKGDTYMGKGVMLHSIRCKDKNAVRGKYEDRFIRRHNLTKRELEILSLIAQALSNKEIAERLYISDQTVSVHRKNIMRKLSVSNTAGLIKVAYDNSLV